MKLTYLGFSAIFLIFSIQLEGFAAPPTQQSPTRKSKRKSIQKKGVASKKIQGTSNAKQKASRQITEAEAVQLEDTNCRTCKTNSSNRILEITKLLNTAGELGPLDNDFYFTNLGPKIQKACVDKLGKDQATSIVSSAFQKTMSCLKELNSPHSLENLKKIVSMLKDNTNPPKVLCNSLKYSPDEDWDGTIAYSSGPNMKNHPYISLNPYTLDQRSSQEKTESISHEILHNVGHNHITDIDYCYTCAACCTRPSSDPAHEISCKICKGSYTDVYDKAYLKDILKFFSLESRSYQNINILLHHLKQKPKDREAQFLLASANLASYTSPLGVAFANSLRDRYEKTLSPKEKSILEQTEKLSDSPLVDAIAPYAKYMTDALFMMLDGNANGAEQLIRKSRHAVLPKESSIPKEQLQQFRWALDVVHNLRAEISGYTCTHATTFKSATEKKAFYDTVKPCE